MLADEPAPLSIAHLSGHLAQRLSPLNGFCGLAGAQDVRAAVQVVCHFVHRNQARRNAADDSYEARVKLVRRTLLSDALNATPGRNGAARLAVDVVL